MYKFLELVKKNNNNNIFKNTNKRRKIVLAHRNFGRQKNDFFLLVDISYY